MRVFGRDDSDEAFSLAGQLDGVVMGQEYLWLVSLTGQHFQCACGSPPGSAGRRLKDTKRSAYVAVEIALHFAPVRPAHGLNGVMG